MKGLLIIFLSLISISFYGQTEIKDSLNNPNDSTNKFFPFDFYYGYRSSFQSFYNQLNTTNNFKFNKPLQTLGIGMSGEFNISRADNFNGHFIYSQIIPQTIHIKDTIKCKITGFIFSFAYGRTLLTAKSGIFNLGFYLGFNTGRLRMYGNELVRQKNPFFSPKIGLQPKIKLGHIDFTFIFEYEYDISKSDWKRTLFSNNDKVSLNNLRQTGITAQVGIGYTYK